MSKKRFIIRRTVISSMDTLISSMVAMSFSKLIFDNFITGVILFQLYQLANTAVSMVWTGYLTSDRTRSIRLQKKFLPYYNKFKMFNVVIRAIQLAIVITTGFEYLMPMLFAVIIFTPINSMINAVESRVEVVILDSDSMEDLTHLQQRKSLFTGMAGMIGIGLSSVVLYTFDMSVFPLWFCISGMMVVGFLDDIECSKYINRYRDSLIKYYDEKHEEMKTKDVYNEVIVDA